MFKLRHLFIFFLGILLSIFFSSGITYISKSFPEILNERIGFRISNRINEFSEVLFKTYTLLKQNQYQIENDSTPDGVSLFDFKEDNIYLLTGNNISYKNSEINLFQLSNNNIIKSWYPDMKVISSLTENSGRLKNGQEVFLNHPIMLKDSSIIFNTDYSLVKINNESNIEWLKLNNSHHSIELDADGYIWTCGSDNEFNSADFKLKDINKENFRNDLILKIDPKNGNTIYQKSIIDILNENNLSHLLTSNGSISLDPVHLNDVQPAIYDGKFWNKGDLLLSSRHLSLIMLYRPQTNKLLWYKQGPWLNQHDPDFFESDKIVIFGNQNIRGDDKYFDYRYPYNKIFIFNFNDESIESIFELPIKKNKIFTQTQGRSELIHKNLLFVEDTNSGRVFLLDTIQKKMEYVKRVNEKNIAHLNWSRIIKN